MLIVLLISFFALSLQVFSVIPTVRTAYTANRIILDFMGLLIESADKKGLYVKYNFHAIFS